MRIEVAKSYSNAVKGWLGPEEADLLYRLASCVPSNEAIVELGSWHGKSSIMLGAGSLAGSNAPVFAVDYFQPTGMTAGFFTKQLAGKELDYLPVFQENIERAGVASVVTPIRGSTVDVAMQWHGAPIGLLFIDADHNYTGVRDDFYAWLPKCKTNCMIAFHDYASEWPGVTRFVDPLVITRTCRSAKLCGSIAYGRFSTAPHARARAALYPSWLLPRLRNRLARRIMIRGGIFRRHPDRILPRHLGIATGHH